MRRSPIKRRGKRAILNRELDALWSRVVRQRAGNRCEVDGCNGSPQGAHIFPKGSYPALRHDPDNGASLCWAHHLGPRGWHKHPLFWAEWIEKKRGRDFMRKLGLRAQTASRPDRAGIKLALEAML